ncbi:MAG: ABC transporter permease [Caldilineaceae bacterium]
MRKTWLIALSTYQQRVRTGSFLVLTLGLPIIMVIAGSIPFFLEGSVNTLSVVGVVDETGELVPVHQLSVNGPSLTLHTYTDQEQAAAAQQRGEIGAYLVVPPGYFAGAPPTLYATAGQGGRLERGLADFLRRALLPGAPTWLPARLAHPATFTYTTNTPGAEVAGGVGLFIRILTPIALALLFGLMVFTGASQMGSAMVREKDQRALEMVITSLTPRQLVMGKVLGLTLLSLTQIGIWTLGGAVAVTLAFAGAIDFQTLTIPWQALIWAMLLGIPAYFLYAVLAAGLGIIAGDSQQAQQLAGILGFLGLAPFWFIGIIIGAPNSRLTLALTLFPLTSPMISLLRMALTTVPLWQLSTAFALILISLLVSVWFVARIFRTAMLLYGQSVRPRAIWQALRTA